MSEQAGNERPLIQFLEQVAESKDCHGQDMGDLWSILYEDLHRLASYNMRNDRNNGSLHTTVLVHEAFLKLAGGQSVRWESRAHFLGIAARAMRQVLIDLARRRNTAKRGGGQQAITLSSMIADDSEEFDLEMISLESALVKLNEKDTRVARVAEMRIFSGMTEQEMAEVLGVSIRTVGNDWAMARMWLSRELQG